MQIPRISNPQLIKLVATYWQWRPLWIATTLAFAFIGIVYVLLLKGDVWLASQGIIVRDEATGAVMRLGRFQSQTEMKAAQETILEMAVNAQVLRNALTTVGREPGGLLGWFSSGDKPPTTSEIDQLTRGSVQIRAPRGAELGTTEVIYLDVKQSSPERAVALNRAVFDALQAHMQQVRQARADGVIAELKAADETIRNKLVAATDQLTQMETEAGADLSDLRGMTDSNSGGSSTRQVLDSIKSELRQAELLVQQLKTDLQLATTSFENPDQLLLTPSNLINSQAGLKSLRDGLAAATIRASQMQGRYTPNHPLVEAALQSEANLRIQLRNELGLSVKTLSKDIGIADERVSKLKSQQTQLESRLEKIARIRAEYSNVASDVKSLNQQLQETSRELGQAQSARLAATTSSLIARMDEPILGEKPIGPGRTMIVAGATFSGMFFGFGLVFLLSPLGGGATYGRRRLDNTNAGRRESDVPPLAQTPNPATAAAELPPIEIEVPEWARTPALTKKFVSLVDSWRISQQPLVSAPESKRTDAPLAGPPKTKEPIAKPTPPNIKSGTVAPGHRAASLGAPLDSHTSTFATQANMPPGSKVL